MPASTAAPKFRSTFSSAAFQLAPTAGSYRADIVVEDHIVLECKAGSAISPGHQAQLIHYLKATSFTLGIILNFGPKPTFKRMLRSGA